MNENFVCIFTVKAKMESKTVASISLPNVGILLEAKSSALLLGYEVNIL